MILSLCSTFAILLTTFRQIQDDLNFFEKNDGESKQGLLKFRVFIWLIIIMNMVSIVLVQRFISCEDSYRSRKHVVYALDIFALMNTFLPLGILGL